MTKPTRRELGKRVVDEFGMNLPDGMECADCRFYSYCKKLFGCKPDATVCDWAPSRFQLPTTQYVEAVAALKKTGK